MYLSQRKYNLTITKLQDKYHTSQIYFRDLTEVLLLSLQWNPNYFHITLIINSLSNLPLFKPESTLFLAGI